jgi:hypothetical protein
LGSFCKIAWSDLENVIHIRCSGRPYVDIDIDYRRCLDLLAASYRLKSLQLVEIA